MLQLSTFHSTLHQLFTTESTLLHQLSTTDNRLLNRLSTNHSTLFCQLSFRGAKTLKLKKKNRCVFGDGYKFWKKDGGKLRKTCKHAYLGSIFMPEKYVIRACFENPFTRMISNLKYKYPLPQALNLWIFKDNLRIN